jgi:hypothetical protein
MERLGMKFRGTETWYDMETLVYEITQGEWQRQVALRPVPDFK